MTTPIDRETLETQFRPEELFTLPEEVLATVQHAPSVHFLRDIGLPTRHNPWFDLIDASSPDLMKVGACYDDMSVRWPNLPESAHNWVLIGMIPYDDIALDVSTGVIHCLPQDEEAYPFNKDLHSFAHFLYLLEKERPNYDEELEQELDPEGAAQRLKANMREVDPDALEVPHSRWHDILEWVEYPDAR